MNDIGLIRDTLAAIGAAWRSGDAAALETLFHPDMAIAGPGHRRLASGRAACVESHREFTANVRILHYEAGDPAIDVWGDTAVCSYAWSMRRQCEGTPVEDRGSEQFVLARGGGRWLAVHRPVLFGAAPT